MIKFFNAYQHKAFNQCMSMLMFMFLGSPIGAIPMSVLSEFGLSSETFYAYRLTDDYSTNSLASQNYIKETMIGNYLIESGQVAKAQTLFGDMLPDKAYGSPEQILRTLSKIALESNKTSESLALAQQALLQNESDVNSLVLLSQIFLSKHAESKTGPLRLLSNDYSLNEALKYLNKAKSLESSNTLVLETLAKIYLEKQDIPKLLECYRNITQINPRDLNAQIIYINILLKTNNLTEGIAQLENFISQRKGFTKAYEWLAEAYISLGKGNEAFRWVKEGLLIEPNNKALMTFFDSAATLISQKGGPSVISQYAGFANDYPHSMAVQRLYALKLEENNANDVNAVLKQWETVLSVEPENSDTLFKIAGLYKRNGRVNDAIDVTSRSLVHGTNIDAFSLLTMLLIDESRTTEAIEILEKEIRLSPGNGEIYKLLAEAQAQAGQYTEYAQTIERGANAATPSPLLLAMYANILADREQTTKANETFRKALDLDKANAMVFGQYLAFLNFNGRSTETLKLIEDFKLNSNMPSEDLDVLLGDSSLLGCDIELACQHYEASLKKNANQPLITVRLLSLMLQTGNYNRCHEILSDTHYMSYLSKEAQQRFLAILLHREGKTSEALLILNKLQKMSVGEDKIPYYQTEFDLYCDNKEYAKALSFVNQIEKVINSNSREVLFMKTIVLTNEKQFEEALDLINRYLVKNQDDDLALNYLANIYIEAKRFDEAIATLHKALSLNRHNDRTLNSLGYILADTKQSYDESLFLINYAMAQAPSAPHIWDSKGWVLYRMGYYEQAMKWLKSAQKYIGANDEEMASHIKVVEEAISKRRTNNNQNH